MSCDTVGYKIYVATTIFMFIKNLSRQGCLFQYPPWQGQTLVEYLLFSLRVEHVFHNDTKKSLKVLVFVLYILEERTLI